MSCGARCVSSIATGPAQPMVSVPAVKRSGVVTPDSAGPTTPAQSAISWAPAGLRFLKTGLVSAGISAPSGLGP